MKKSIFALAVIFLFVLISCKEKDRPTQMVAQLNPTDTFLFEFPKRNGVVDSSFHNEYLLFQKSVGLQYLEKGFDSIQIRLWYGGSFTGHRIVILSNKNGKWIAELSKVTYTINPNYKRKSSDNYWEEYIPSRNIEYKTPKSGWEKFIKELFRLNILTLPNEDDIKGFKRADYTDGSGILGEIATKNVYRAYSYGEMDSDLEKYEQLQNISHILKLIDEEFGLEKLWDYTNEIPEKIDDDNKIKINEMTIQEVPVPVKKKKRK
jgi:hypothetical protein